MRYPVLLLCALLTGCPDSKTPDVSAPPPISAAPTAHASEAASVPDPPVPITSSNWSVSVTSELPGINPDMFDSKERKAKMFFDHHATAANGKVSVEHKILGTTSDVDAAAASELDLHMAGVDWEAVAQAAKSDGATEGGTTFKFVVTVGQASWEITTTNIERHPELTAVVDALKAATGRP